MEIIPSIRGSVYVKDGFVYHSNQKKGEIRYLKCVTPSCKGRAKLKDNGSSTSTPHNHPPDKLARETILLKSALKWAAISDAHKKASEIFRDVCKRYPNAAHRIGYNQVRSTIYRCRAMGGSYLDKVDVRNLFDEVLGVEHQETNEGVEAINERVEAQETNGGVGTQENRTIEVDEAQDTNGAQESRPTEGDEARDTNKTDVESDVPSKVNYSSMAKYTKRARESATAPEAEPRETPDTSNIESVPCASTSNIQFVASEITSLQYPDFGTLEESGMGQFVLPSLVEKKSSKSRDVTCRNEEETVVSINNSTNTTITTSTSTATSTDVTATKFTNDTQSKTTSRQKWVTPQEETESERMIKYMVSQRKLDSVIDKLESVTTKLTAATVGDQYEQFGKYVGSLLRGMPIRKVNSLKKKILADVLAVVEGKEREPPCLKTTGTQVGLDVLATEKAYKKFITEQSQGKSPSTDSQSTLNSSNMVHYSNIGSNISMLGGNMPLLFPGVSTSTTPFKILPVIPVAATSTMASNATVVTTPSLLGSNPSVHSLPMTPSETFTTVAKSADGTLLAVTIPKPQMSETVFGSEQSLLQPPRGQKRKQTTPAYLMEKKTVRSTQSQGNSRDNGGKEVIIRSPQPMIPCSCKTSTQTVTKSGEDFSVVSQTIDDIEKRKQMLGSSQSWEDVRDSGGGKVTIGNPQPTENEMEYEIDIEEGKELLQIKQDQDLFETVLCDESSSFHIKEEAPDLEDTLEDSPTDTIALDCPHCSTQCNNRDDLVTHLSTLHPGSNPPAKNESEGSYFVT